MKLFGDLELEEDDGLRRGELVAQRIGWAALFLFILAALLGLLGQGPLGEAVAGNRADPLWIEYDRFIRSENPTGITINAHPDREYPGYVDVGFEPEYMERMSVENIVPEPESASTSNRRVTYVFRVPDDSEGAVPILFTFEPKKAGWAETTVVSGNRDSVKIRQFVYP